MLIAIILIVLNVLIVGALLFILRGVDSAPKLQIPDEERVKKPSEITEIATPQNNKKETVTRI